MLDFSYETVGPKKDIVAISLVGELTTENCDYLQECVKTQIEEGCQRLIINCERMSYISSLGLGMLVRNHSRMKKLGGDVKLARLHGKVAEILHLVKLDRVFELYPTVEDAINSFE